LIASIRPKLDCFVASQATFILGSHPMYPNTTLSFFSAVETNAQSQDGRIGGNENWPSIPSNWEEKAGLSSRWETELEPVKPESQQVFFFFCAFAVRAELAMNVMCAYLTGRAARAVPMRPGAQQELASPAAHSRMKTWPFKEES
jgi:hypothetical protein